MHESAPGVFVCADDVVFVDDGVIAALKAAVPGSPLGRVRLCAHRHADDRVQEMLIVLGRASYVRPHRHLAKTESFHVVEGEADVVVFADDGAIERVVPLGPPGGGWSFFYRLQTSRFHTVLIRSEYLVIHETTNGPFRPDETVQASWAPADDDDDAVARYVAELERRIGRPQMPGGI
ncbi:MAG: WbuC family cupin fold metalloprotein [Deltaproteobacteria bacterium]|nr:WbuC family cupin fold metalloprotein [Deltaproteobacteria bacterium]